LNGRRSAWPVDRGEVADRVVDERCVEEARATHELER
jgi:hypothetical protein